MTPHDRSRVLRLWWAGPTAVAVAGGLAFAVGFAPRLADRVTLPHDVAVASPARTEVPVAVHARVTPRKTSHPRPRTTTPTPSVTSAPVVVRAGSTSGGSTVVQPSRPVVTTRTPDDDRWSGSPSQSPSGSPTDGHYEGGDG